MLDARVDALSALICERAKIVPVVHASDFPDYTQEDFDRAMNGVDMCFVLDTTGSMSDTIYAARTQVGTILDRFTEQHPGTVVNLALVAYRDVRDARRLEVLHFTTDPDAFRVFCASLEATGGDDFPEDLGSALEYVPRLGWKSVTRMVYVIGDAPCHGRQFCEPDRASLDDFPDEHPLGVDILRAVEVLRDEVRLDSFHFGRITPHTDVMVAALKAAFDRPAQGIELQTFDLTLDVRTKPSSKSQAEAKAVENDDDDDDISSSAPPSYGAAVGARSRAVVRGGIVPPAARRTAAHRSGRDPNLMRSLTARAFADEVVDAANRSFTGSMARKRGRDE